MKDYIIKGLADLSKDFGIDVWIKVGNQNVEKVSVCFHNPQTGQYTSIDIWHTKVENADESIREIFEYIQERLVVPLSKNN